MSRDVAMLVVLPKDGVHSLLNLGAFQRVGLCHDHLFLLFGDVGFSEEMPSLNFCRKLDTMFLQVTQALIMVSDGLQKALPASTSMAFEVGWEVCRHLHPAVILKGGVQQGKDALEGSVSAGLLEVKVFDQLPCCSLQRAEKVQNTFSLAVGQFHLLPIDGDSLTPFLVVGWSPIEDWNIAVTGALLVQNRSTTTYRSSRHSSGKALLVNR